MSLKYGLLGAALGLALAAGAPAADPKTQAAARPSWPSTRTRSSRSGWP